MKKACYSVCLMLFMALSLLQPVVAQPQSAGTLRL